MHSHITHIHHWNGRLVHVQQIILIHGFKFAGNRLLAYITWSLAIHPYHFLWCGMDCVGQGIMNITHEYQMMVFSELEWAQDKRSESSVLISTA